MSCILISIPIAADFFLCLVSMAYELSDTEVNHFPSCGCGRAIEDVADFMKLQMVPGPFALSSVSCRSWTHSMGQSTKAPVIPPSVGMETGTCFDIKATSPIFFSANRFIKWFDVLNWYVFRLPELTQNEIFIA